MGDERKLTGAERLALRRLKVLEETWPESLWIFAAGGDLHVMRTTTDGHHAVTDEGSVDQNALVESFEIDADGGDW